MLTPRVAVICDYREEGWPSMDLAGEMLLRHLDSFPVVATAVRPRMRRRLSRWSRRLWNADRLLARFWDYPRHLRQSRERYHVFHLVDHSYSHLVHELPAERTVITCHDLDTFECLLEPNCRRRSAAFRAMTRRILDGFRRAARIVCVSQATRAAIEQRGLADPARVLVVENGVDPALSPEAGQPADAEVERRLGPEAPGGAELLHVGSTAPRKRIDMLLRIFAAVRKQRAGARLIRVGGFTPEHRRLIEALGLGEAIVELPFVPKDLLAAVYRRASLLLFPSAAEGFGLPVTEALACGTSVVASDIPVLREVGGPAVSFCSAGDVDHWTHTILEQLNDRPSPEQREQKRRANLAQAHRYSWQRTAGEMAAVYHDLFQAHCHA